MSRAEDAPELPVDEALARMRLPLTDDEREETLALVAWFTQPSWNRAAEATA